MESEFAGIEQTFELIDCIMDSIDNDIEFMDNSLTDILEN
jgi:hypothetical protein